MKALNEMKWEAFDFSEIFDITATKSGVDKCRLEQKSGCVPYITRTDKNNGWDNFVGVQKYQKDSANVITIGLDTQTVFYQPIPFYTGQNIQILTSQNLNKYVALFLIPLIKIQMKKFNWGGNGATLGRLKRLKLVLPVSTPHIPDYEYMCEYSKYIEHRQLESINQLALKTIESIKSIADLNWESFGLLDLFYFKKGNQNNMNSLTRGNIPLISAKKIDNGYKDFVSKNKKDIYQGDCISLNLDGDGGAGLAYYQPAKMLVDSHVGILTPKFRHTKYVLLFIAQCISKQSDMFGHGYPINGSRIRTFRIMLPVSSHNNPDYCFMDSYMRSVESMQLKKYIERKLNKSMCQY